MASWLKSLFSPTRNWGSITRLRRYGIIWSNCLKDMVGYEKEIINLSKDEAKSKSLENLIEVEMIIGYTFNNRSLLHEAFTHASSHKDCKSYERLEYVGDSVLNFLITKEQFSRYPDLPPGLLSPLRAANVDTEKLARVAVQHHFHRYIRFGPLGTHAKQIQAFIKVLPKHPLHSHGLLNAPKVLADVVESTIGAVFVDSNFSIETTWEVTSSLLKPIITPETLQKNAVMKLFEICQKHKLKIRLVDLWTQAGTYEVYVNNEIKGKGLCREKKDVALNRAANGAYKEVLRMLNLKN